MILFNRTVWVTSQFTSKFTYCFCNYRSIANRAAVLPLFDIIYIWQNHEFTKFSHISSDLWSFIVFCSCSWWQYSKLENLNCACLFVCVCLYVCMHTCFKLLKYTPRTIKLIDFLLWTQHYEYTKVIQLSTSYFFPSTGNVSPKKHKQ